MPAISPWELEQFSIIAELISYYLLFACFLYLAFVSPGNITCSPAMARSFDRLTFGSREGPEANVAVPAKFRGSKSRNNSGKLQKLCLLNRPECSHFPFQFSRVSTAVRLVGIPTSHIANHLLYN